MNPGPNIITDGLVFVMDAANQKSYISGGSILNDLSSFGGSYKLFNTPSYNSNYGGCLVFDHNYSQYATSSVDIPQVSSASQTVPLTINVWAYLSGFGGDPGIERASTIFGRGNQGQGSYGIGSSIGLDGSLYVQAGFRFQYTSYIPVQQNEIFYVTYVYAGITNPATLVYKNGRLFESFAYKSNGFGWSTQPFASFMNRAVTGGNVAYSSGGLFYASVYNRALSAAEVLQNYNATKGRFNL